MPEMIFIERNGESRACVFTAGESVLNVAQRNAVDIEGACEGAMACSTCHVIVESEWYARLPKPYLEENDMLDLARDVTCYSRLGCQIVLTDALDGLTVTLP
jgi:2Fe-2S ferredoxin